MNEAEIRKYAELMRELDLTGLEVTENGCVVRLERTPAAPVVPGVILCEILAQSAGILMQDSLTEDTIPM